MAVLPSSVNASAAADECCTPTERRLLGEGEAAGHATTFRALADPTRVQIVWLLAEVAELCVCDINTNFALEASTMSHHLKVLREAGLISSEKRGLWVFYRLRPRALDTIREFATH